MQRRLTRPLITAAVGAGALMLVLAGSFAFQAGRSGLERRTTAFFVPPGLGEIRSSAVDIKRGNLAVATSIDGGSRSFLVQKAGNHFAETAIDGKVWRVRIGSVPSSSPVQPDEHRVLVQYRNDSGSTFAIVDGGGRRLFEMDAENRTADISIDGSVVHTASFGPMGDPLTSVRLYTLTGELLGEIPVPEPLAGVIVPDAGSAILATGYRIERRTLEGSAWIHDLGDLPAEGLGVLDDERFVVFQSQGRFKILDVDGRLVYDYDPVQVGDRFWELEESFFFNLRPHARDRNHVVLYDQVDVSENFLILNLRSGRLQLKQLNTRPPHGYSVSRVPADGSVVFVGAHDLFLRRIDG